MKYIRHRINTIQQLTQIEDRSCGCEIDLRSFAESAGKLHLSHDPWVIGDSFEEWLKKYSELEFKGPLILNTKEDGLESRILELLKKFKLDNFFFLDTTIPTTVKLTQSGEKRVAVRYSTYEPENLIKNFEGLASWIWVDCFDGIYPPFEKLPASYKVCLVSPELHGKELKDSPVLRKWLNAADAICTKVPEKWKNLI